MIEIISPAGFEKYFMELAEATAAAGGYDRIRQSLRRSPSASACPSISPRYPISLLAMGCDRLASGTGSSRCEGPF